MNQVATVCSPIPLLAQLLQSELSPDNACDWLTISDASAEDAIRRSLCDPLITIAQRGGKGLRSNLLQTSWLMAGATVPCPDELIGIVEGMHLGSLIVDDIEDRSPTRRGGPSLHEQFGIPTALNAGNWLYFWPHLMLRRIGLTPEQELTIRRSIDRTLLNAHVGQAIDVSVRVSDLRQSQVASIVQTCSDLKTGCLMEFSAELGAIAGGGDPQLIMSLKPIARRLGVALQMLDDLTSLSNPTRASKAAEDICQGRPTWAWAWLASTLDAVAYGRVRQLSQRVLDGRADPNTLADTLALQASSHGRRQIRASLSEIVEAGQSALSNRRGWSDLRSWITMLETYEG